ncbi:pentatricopeptide repeat-containing protein [Tanacetum coccineum]
MVYRWRIDPSSQQRIIEKEGLTMGGVSEKFLITSMLMWAVPIAILYAFNSNLVPEPSDKHKPDPKFLADAKISVKHSNAGKFFSNSEERKVGGYFSLSPPPVSLNFENNEHSVTPTTTFNHHSHHHTSLTTTHTFPRSSLTSLTLTLSQHDVTTPEDDTHRQYDFTPLLTFLSGSDSSQQLTESQLADSYRSVPPSLWHYLLKTLSTSPQSLSTTHALLDWLHRYNLCYAYEFMYSIMVHALSRPEMIYEGYLHSQKHPVTPFTYNVLIGACARNDDLEKAVILMNKMRGEGYRSDFVNYSLIIQSLIRSDKIESRLLEKLYDEMVSDGVELDVQLLNDIVLGFTKCGDVDKAMYFLGVIQGNGLSVKTSTVVSVISELGSLGRAEEAEAVFEEIKDGGLMPRTRAYNGVLKAYVNKGCLRDAEWVVNEMERNGVMPDEYTYSLLIEAYGNAGRWESARIVLKEMEENNVKASSYVFCRILVGYRDRGEWQRLFQVLKEMQKCGVKPDRQFYNVMIDTFGKYNCLDNALEILERMRNDGIEPDTVTWNTLIDCHCKCGYHSKAEELFDEMQQSGCLPCVATYNIMIKSFGEQERWEGVRSLLRKMKSEGLQPNVITYTTLVDIYGRSGRFIDATECLEDMKSAGLKPTSTIYNALINAYAQRGLSEEALNAFRVMRSDGLKPSNLALNALINAFCEDRRDAEAFAVLRSMKENDLKPDVVTYTTLMKALIRVEKFEEMEGMVLLEADNYEVRSLITSYSVEDGVPPLVQILEHHA